MINFILIQHITQSSEPHFPHSQGGDLFLKVSSRDFLGGPVIGNLSSNEGDVGLMEKEKATHSSILAWRIPWTEETGRPQSMGSQESDKA